MTMEAEIARRTEAEMARCMEAEIERRTEVEVARRVAVFQRHFTGGLYEQGEDPQGFFTGTGREAQYADVDVVQGRQCPPPPFGRSGVAAGPAMRTMPLKYIAQSWEGGPCRLFSV
jgi:hypothetical protein